MLIKLQTPEVYITRGVSCLQYRIISGCSWVPPKDALISNDDSVVCGHQARSDRARCSVSLASIAFKWCLWTLRWASSASVSFRFIIGAYRARSIDTVKRFRRISTWRRWQRQRIQHAFSAIGLCSESFRGCCCCCSFLSFSRRRQGTHRLETKIF